MWNLLHSHGKIGFSKNSENWLQGVCKPLPRFSRAWCPHPKNVENKFNSCGRLCFPRTSATIFLIPYTFLQLIMLTLTQMRYISSTLKYEWAYDSIITNRMRQKQYRMTSVLNFYTNFNIFHLWLLKNTGYIPCVVSLNLPYKQWFVSPTPQTLHCPSTSSLWVTTSLWSISESVSFLLHSLVFFRFHILLLLLFSC